MEYEQRVGELANKTVLTETEARVQALIEEEKTRHEIADRLEMAVSTVDTHKQRIKQRIIQAQGTIEEMELDTAHSNIEEARAITTPPLEKVDIAHGLTPEEAVVKVIQQQPAFSPDRDNKYISPRPALMNSKPRHLGEAKFDSEAERPSGVDPVVFVDHDSVREGYSRVVIRNVWLEVDWTDGMAEVKFRISLTAPTDAISGEKPIAYGAHRWRAERMSTEPR